MPKVCLLYVFFGLCLASFTLFATQEKIHVAFVSPSPATAGFWHHYVQSMQAAAEQLGIDLSVLKAAHDDRFSHLDAVQKVLDQAEKPDYLVTLFRHSTSKKMLQAIENSGVRFFATNTDLPEKDFPFEVVPRKQFKSWIGHMHPDDFAAGQALMVSLGSTLPKKNDTPYNVIAFTGARDSTAVSLRNEGLVYGLKKLGDNFRLKQLVFTDWRYDTAAKMVLPLFRRHKKIDIIWCANDTIASAVVSKVNRIIPSNLPKVGGIDWTAQSIRHVSQDELSAALGGHFIEGGAILALLYDYHNGDDFADVLGTQFSLKLSQLSESDSLLIKKMVQNNDYSDVDFNRLRMPFNSQHSKWSSNYKSLISAIRRW